MGGDCCAQTVKGGKVKTNYCKQCKCIDPGAKCDGSCGAPKFKGDGVCDDNNNNCGCQYDGGDCCAKTLKKAVSKTYCKQCLCLDPAGCEAKCGSPKYKGDGNCDDENNNCGCAYDGGDCCPKTVSGGTVKTKFCTKCECLDPAGCDGTCKFPNYKGEGNCDDENNNCGCEYDGGDCCKKTVSGGTVNTKFCSKCQCLDPKGK